MKEGEERVNQQTKPSLIAKSLHPENQESPIHFIEKWKTPLQYFYRRNHFSYPLIYSHSYQFVIDGVLPQPIIINYTDLLTMPSKEIVVPLECAGNKRSNFYPKVYGEQWEDGAMSQGKWKGVSLNYILKALKVDVAAKEVVFVGSDNGKRTDLFGQYYYARSLPLEKALHPDTIIAYMYNDQPLSLKHGYPLRLIVPQWYAMASVKWLQTIKFIQGTFNGPFQTVDYMYYPNKENDDGKKPVTTNQVNSTIQKPLNYEILDEGNHLLKGIAWTGLGEIDSVEVSVDKGQTWHEANISFYEKERYAWVSWSYHWTAKKGEYTLLSRARDTFGRVQPDNAFWNRKGYGYNAVSKIEVKVE